MSQLSQEGKTRYTHYSIAYHLVWIPKYRRKILVGDVEAETKRLIHECCERHKLKLLALETDIDHVYIAEKTSSGLQLIILVLLERYLLRLLEDISQNAKVSTISLVLAFIHTP